jgi:hypothetical protein
VDLVNEFMGGNHASMNLAWGAVVYDIWRQRNDLKHGIQIRREEILEMVNLR